MLYKYVHLDIAEQLALHSIACVGFVRTFVPFILVRVCVCVPDHVPLCAAPWAVARQASLAQNRYRERERDNVGFKRNYFKFYHFLRKWKIERTQKETFVNCHHMVYLPKIVN